MTDMPHADLEPIEDRDKALRKAYSIATRRLREDHLDEFNQHYSETARALGHDWTPRPSAEQQAEEQFNALVETYPFLADRLRERE